MPGLVLVLLGVIGYALALPGVSLLGAVLDVHTLLVSSLFILAGVEAMAFSVLVRRFAVSEGLLPSNPQLRWMLKLFRLERGLIVGASFALSGGVLLASALRAWWLADFGPLNYPQTMRVVVPGVTLSLLGFQIVLVSFFLNILGMHRK